MTYFLAMADSSVVTEGHYDASFETEEPPPTDHMDRQLPRTADRHVVDSHQLGLPKIADRHVVDPHQLGHHHVAEQYPNAASRAGKMSPLTQVNNTNSTVNTKGIMRHNNNGSVLPLSFSGNNIAVGQQPQQQFGYSNPLASVAQQEGVPASSFGTESNNPHQQQRPNTVVDNRLELRTTTAKSLAAAPSSTTGNGGIVTAAAGGVIGGGRSAVMSPHSAQTVPTHISRLGHQHQLSQVSWTLTCTKSKEKWMLRYYKVPGDI
jgi:hypothetical protein